MKTIWKFTLNQQVNTLMIPKGYEVLSLVEQHNNITLYCMVNPNEDNVETQFLVLGTGWDLPGEIDSLKFIGTVLTLNGALVWHIFQDKEDE